MPISRDEFEKGEIDPSVFVLEFLKSNANTAYSLTQLLQELAAKGLSLSEEDLLKIMSSLEGRRRVESKTRRDVIYYIYHKVIGFRGF